MFEGTNTLQSLSKYFSEVPELEMMSFIDNWFRKETVKKRELIFDSGTPNTRHYFIENGLLRLYIIDASGKEFNLLFAREGQIIGDLNTPKPSIFSLDALEDSVLYSVSDEGLRELYKLHARYGGEAGISMLIRSYLFLQRRFVSILSRSAEENYAELQQQNPELLQRLPQYHIASYLGVSAEFLSKIIARSVKKDF